MEHEQNGKKSWNFVISHNDSHGIFNFVPEFNKMCAFFIGIKKFRKYTLLTLYTKSCGYKI